MKTPTTTSAQSVAINLGLNLLFVIGGNFLAWAVYPLTHKEHHWAVQAALNAALGLGELREGGIALASTLSNTWQTHMLVKALNARTGVENKARESTTSFLKVVSTGALISSVIGIGVYQWFLHQKDWLLRLLRRGRFWIRTLCDSLP